MATNAKASEIAAEARERAEAALESAREALDQAKVSARETYKQAKGAVEDGLDDTHRYMKRQWKERPVAVAATAVGVGLLVGLLLGSRR
ncbi:MAG TPA: hypothetical protein PKY87_17410 [Terricaulis sp.]|nr:hypothetical protein [Terricaulis sp.]